MGACPPGVQRTSPANSASNFNNISGWMGLEESPHCSFDVIEARGIPINQAGEAAALRPGRRPSATGRTTALSDKK